MRRRSSTEKSARGFSRRSWHRITRPAESGGAGPQSGGSSSLSVAFDVQLLGESLPRLLKTDFDIEDLRILPPLSRCQEEQLAAAKPRLFLHGLDEGAADSAS